MANTYIKPETEIIKIELQLMQQTSFGKDTTTENQITDEGDVLGKEFSFFEPEELDEE